MHVPSNENGREKDGVGGGMLKNFTISSLSSSIQKTRKITSRLRIILPYPNEGIEEYQNLLEVAENKVIIFTQRPKYGQRI